MNGKKEREVFVESITLDKSEIVMNNYRPNIESNVLNEPKLCSKWCSKYFKKKDKTGAPAKTSVKHRYMLA